MAYTKRDSKDPMPTADYTQRGGFGGNEPGTADEKHGQKKSMKITASQNRTTGPVAMAVDQPTRQNGDGNEPVTGELHNQKKSMRIGEDQRW